MLLRRTAQAAGLGGFAAAAFSQLDGDGPAAAYIFSQAVMPALRLLDAESAHRAAVLSAPLMPVERASDAPVLRTTLWGRKVSNPVGLAAGFDKDAEAFNALFGAGFGLVEIGSVTPRPQPGNPKPRVFRLPEDRAVINRYGFNSAGHPAAAERLAKRTGGGGGGGKLLGVNLGKNKETADAAADYTAGVTALGSFADYLVVNVSSPNTPGLRNLQQRDQLRALVRAVRGAVDALPAPRPPLVIKVAPDLNEQQRADVAAVALEEQLDGLIVSNTTIARPASLCGGAASEVGGLSGAPLLAPSTEVLRDLYERTGGRVTLIGAGGIASGADAYAKIRAGASAVQLYTALVYEGPPLVPRVKRELAALLEADGYGSVDEAVGADCKKVAKPKAARRSFFW